MVIQSECWMLNLRSCDFTGMTNISLQVAAMIFMIVIMICLNHIFIFNNVINIY